MDQINPLKTAHAAPDAAVLQAYNFNPNSDLLAQLLTLNQQVAANIDTGASVTAPGIPRIYAEPAPPIAPDCIQLLGASVAATYPLQKIPHLTIHALTT